MSASWVSNLTMHPPLLWESGGDGIMFTPLLYWHHGRGAQHTLNHMWGKPPPPPICVLLSCLCDRCVTSSWTTDLGANQFKAEFVFSTHQTTWTADVNNPSCALENLVSIPGFLWRQEVWAQVAFLKVRGFAPIANFLLEWPDRTKWGGIYHQGVASTCTGREGPLSTSWHGSTQYYWRMFGKLMQRALQQQTNSAHSWSTSLSGLGWLARFYEAAAHAGAEVKLKCFLLKYPLNSLQ